MPDEMKGIARGLGQAARYAHRAVIHLYCETVFLSF